VDICGISALPVAPPDAGGGTCCYGAAVDASRCTCWSAVYDLEQQALRPGLPLPPSPLVMCADCAYRPGSPERRGDETYTGDVDLLEDLVISGAPFYCHRGIRRIVAWQHPEGVEIPGHPGAYDPPIVKSVPYRADGAPANLCAGWLLRRAKLRTAGGPPAAAGRIDTRPDMGCSEVSLADHHDQSERTGK
jgi:hypothetical protein